MAKFTCTTHLEGQVLTTGIADIMREVTCQITQSMLERKGNDCGAETLSTLSSFISNPVQGIAATRVACG